MKQEHIVHFSNQQLLDTLSDQIAILDDNGMIVMVNKAWKEFSEKGGSPPNKTGIGINYFKVLKKANLFSLIHQMKLVISRTRTHYFHTYPCHSPDKEQWFKMIVSAVPTDLTEATCIMVRHTDVTNLIDYQNQVFDILESMTDGFFAINKEWTFTFVNDKAVELLNIPKEELLNKTIWESFPELAGTMIEKHYLYAMEHRETIRVEEYYRPHKTWYLIHIYPRKKGGISVHFQNINNRKKIEEQLRFSAYYDELTSLPNRKFLYEKINDTIAYAQKHNHSFALLFIDLDDFKNINDLYGHQTGDRLLKAVAERLQEIVADKHFVTRFGGDEFVIIFDGDPHSSEFKHFSYTILQQIQKPYEMKDLEKFSTTASIGVSHYPNNGTTPDELLSTSDLAMYEAKFQQGNQLIAFQQSMKESLANKLDLVNDFKSALLTDDIYFVYQPQVDLYSEKIITLEVLTRWKHSEYGLISPDEFIPIAENSGYIKRLTEKQIHTVFEQLSQWRDNDIYQGSLSINLSTSLLSQTSFVQYLIESMKYYQFPTGIIEIEITESVQLLTSEVIKENIDLLNQSGVIIAVDDFGTGYSNFAYLSRFPLNKVKIDSSFIDNIGHDHKVELILYSLIQLTQNLSYLCIAEGVETEDQLSFLEKNGCHLIQGFYFYKPMLADELLPILKKQKR